MESCFSTSCKDQFSAQTRLRGENYFRDAQVDVLAAGSLGFHASVAGSQNKAYEVWLDFSELEHGDLGASCDCLLFQRGENCKHVWALMREAEEVLGLSLQKSVELDLFECTPEWVQIGESVALPQKVAASNGAVAKSSEIARHRQPLWTSVLADVRRRQQQISPNRGTVARSAMPSPRYWYAMSLSDSVGSTHLPIRIYQSKPKKDDEWSIPTKVNLTPVEVRLIEDVQTRRIVSLLERQEDDYYSYRYNPHLSKLILSADLLEETLRELCNSGRFVWQMTDDKSLTDYHQLEWDAGGRWSFLLRIEPAATSTGADGQLQIAPLLRRHDEAGNEQTRSVGEVVAVCDSGALFFEGQVATLEGSDIGWVRAWRRNQGFELPSEELGKLLDELHSTEVPLQLDIHDSLGIERSKETPTCRLQLKSPDLKNDKFLKAEVWFRYGETLVSAQESLASLWDEERRRILVRDLQAETELLAPLAKFPFQEVRYRFDEHELTIHQKWFGDLVRVLTECGWEVLADGKSFRRAGNFNIKVESGEDWFDLQADIDFEGIPSSLPTLLAALKRGDKHVVLDDGTHGILPEDWLRRFAGLSSVGEVDGDSVRFKSNQALMLDMLLQEQENVSVDRNFSSWCKKLKGFSGVKPAKQPRGFQGEMRDYQRDGLGWFKFLSDFRFGGCLADDMGLGKTIQVLALLENRRTRKLKPDEARKPSLAIVPKSLVFNWVEEAAKFAPKLRVLDYTGLQRSERLPSVSENDLIVTTYATFRRDVAMLKDIEFDYAILDEAQAIKNPSAQASKAVRLIQSDHRLAMTGTPVENHLGDLWSLFDFLNPGMLGGSTASTFTVASEDASGRLAALSNALRPFILRRTKEQVLDELPKKTEQTLYCEMSPKQKKLYNELREHYRLSLSGKVKELGINRAKIHVLEALLRLRQAACDPRLVDPKQKTSGAKIELLMEQLDEVLSEGHKVLVFSQFTSLLALVQKELKSRKWDYEYLDGKSRQRAASVKRFQEDPKCSLFLISLKAGGHGLNLTAADYVFILDPWWNPAAEAQAIDRAHRMGQQKPVVAYRMIARGTVEDKIVQLQQSKRELADAIISADQSLIRGLSVEDLQVLFE